MGIESMIGLLALTLVALTSCAIQGDDFVQSQNRVIGRKFAAYAGSNARHFVELNANDKYRELQWTRPDGCSWAYKVRTSDDVMESWRYTSDPTLCKKAYYGGSA